MSAPERALSTELEATVRPIVSPGRRRGWLVRRALAAADIAGLTTSFLVAQWLFAPEGRVADGISPSAETLLFLSTLPAWLVFAKLYGLYDRDEERTDHSTVDDLPGVFQMLIAGVWLFFIVSWLTDIVVPVLGKLVAFWLLAILLIPLLRVGSRAVCRRCASYQQRTVIVGADSVGQAIARKIEKHPEYGLDFVGFIDEREDLPGETNVLASPHELPVLVRRLTVERVIVTSGSETADDTLALIRSLRDLNVQIDLVPRFHELVSPRAGIHAIEGIPLLGLAPAGLSRSSAFLKRAMDVVVATFGLVMLSPLLALIALAIKLDSPGPVLFRQTRIGRGGRSFRLHKFRTMTADAEDLKADLVHLNRHPDGKMFKLTADPRVTPVGRVLRRTCLDELPQLWNVLSGEMSLVGPRPLIPEEARLVRDWAEHRLTLKPGVTGLWQVLGSSSIAFDEMIHLDYLYVTTWSPWGDVRLILRTLPVVLGAANEAA